MQQEESEAFASFFATCRRRIRSGTSNYQTNLSVVGQAAGLQPFLQEAEAKAKAEASAFRAQSGQTPL